MKIYIASYKLDFLSILINSSIFRKLISDSCITTPVMSTRRRCRFLAGVRCGASSRCVLCRWTYTDLPSKVSRRGWMQSASLHNAKLRAQHCFCDTWIGKERKRAKKTKREKKIYIYACIFLCITTALTIIRWRNGWSLQIFMTEKWFFFSLRIYFQHCFHAFQLIIFDIVAQTSVPRSSFTTVDVK